jgi:WD40 repeat protein
MKKICRLIFATLVFAIFSGQIFAMNVTTSTTTPKPTTITINLKDGTSLQVPIEVAKQTSEFLRGQIEFAEDQEAELPTFYFKNFDDDTVKFVFNNILEQAFRLKFLQQNKIQLLPDLISVELRTRKINIKNVWNFVCYLLLFEPITNGFSQFFISQNFLKNKFLKGYFTGFEGQDFLLHSIKNKIWERFPKKYIFTQNITCKSSDCLALLSLDGQMLVSSDFEIIKIWSHQPDGRYNLLQTISSEYDNHLNSPSCLALSADKQTLVSGSRDSTIIIWSRQNNGKYTLKQIITKEQPGHNNGVLCVALSADKQTLVSGSGDKTIKIWSRQENEHYIILQTISSEQQGHTEPVLCLSLSRGEQTLVSSSSDNTIKVWSRQPNGNYTLLQTITSKELNSDGAVSYLALSPDKQTLIAGSNGPIKVLSLQENGHYANPKPITSDQNDIYLINNCFALSPDKQMLVSMGKAMEDIKIWSLQKDGRYTNIQTITQEEPNAHTEEITNLLLSPDKQTLVSVSSDDQKIKIWALTPPIDDFNIDQTLQWLKRKLGIKTSRRYQDAIEPTTSSTQHEVALTKIEEEDLEKGKERVYEKPEKPDDN